MPLPVRVPLAFNLTFSTCEILSTIIVDWQMFRQVFTVRRSSSTDSESATGNEAASNLPGQAARAFESEADDVDIDSINASDLLTGDGGKLQEPVPIVPKQLVYATDRDSVPSSWIFGDSLLERERERVRD